MVRRVCRLLAGLATVVAAAGCGLAAQAGQPGTIAGFTISDHRPAPTDLLGLWRLSAAGASTGMSVQFGTDSNGDLTVQEYLPCGSLSGSWAADGSGQLVGGFDAGGGRCSASIPDGPTGRWLDTATRVTVDSNRIVVSGGDGMLAELTRQVALPARLAAAQRGVGASQRPLVTSRNALALATPRSLPDGSPPARSSQVEGRWAADDARPGPPAGFVSFAPSGSWEGSDGCNGYGGRYEIGPGGQLLLVSLVENGLLGCPTSPAPEWVQRTARISVDGSDLVLVDRGGHRIGELTRQHLGALAGTVRAAGTGAPRGVVDAFEGRPRGPFGGETRLRAGRFRLTVPVGRYVVVAELNGRRECDSRLATVAAGRTTTVTVTQCHPLR